MMLLFFAIQLAMRAVQFVDEELGNLDNGKKKEAALEFSRAELQNLQNAGKLGRRNDGSDTISTIMPLINEAIDVAVLSTHLFQKKEKIERIDPAQAAKAKIEGQPNQ
jgi:hypothetical protein